MKYFIVLFFVLFYCQSISGQTLSKEKDYTIWKKRIQFKTLHPVQSYQYFDYEKSKAELDILYMNYSEGYKGILRITKKYDQLFLTKVNCKDSVCITITDKAIVDSIYNLLPSLVADTITKKDYYVVSYENLKNNEGYFYAYKIKNKYYSCISFESCNFNVLNNKDNCLLVKEIGVFKYLLRKFKDFNIGKIDALCR